MRNFVILGLTGPSGSGKSTFCAYLKNVGFDVIDADVVSKQALQRGSSCVFQLANAFGSDLILPNGEIDRALLAKRAFFSRENTQLLNDITHPWVFLRCFKMIKELVNNGSNLIVFDAPVLFESNGDIMCDFIASVITDRQTRLERIMKRDNITVEQAKQRFNAQQSDSFYIERSDFVIDGAKNENYLIEMALKIKSKALSLKGGD